jgi:hypothetical protein
MEDDTKPSSGSLTSAIAGPDWPARAADTVEEVVAAVYDKVVRPLMLVARGIVFGILVAAMATVLGVLAAIALVRVLDVYAFGHRAWAAEAVVGGLFAVVGVVAFTLSRPRSRQAEEG